MLKAGGEWDARGVNEIGEATHATPVYAGVEWRSNVGPHARVPLLFRDSSDPIMRLQPRKKQS